MLRAAHPVGMRTTKLVPKFVSVARAMAGPRTASGKTSPTMIQEMGPKLTCTACNQTSSHDGKSQEARSSLAGMTRLYTFLAAWRLYSFDLPAMLYSKGRKGRAGCIKAAPGRRRRR